MAVWITTESPQVICSEYTHLSLIKVLHWKPVMTHQVDCFHRFYKCSMSETVSRQRGESQAQDMKRRQLDDKLVQHIQRGVTPLYSQDYHMQPFSYAPLVGTSSNTITTASVRSLAFLAPLNSRGNSTSLKKAFRFGWVASKAATSLMMIHSMSCIPWGNQQTKLLQMARWPCTCTC